MNFRTCLLFNIRFLFYRTSFLAYWLFKTILCHCSFHKKFNKGVCESITFLRCGPIWVFHYPSVTSIYFGSHAKKTEWGNWFPSGVCNENFGWFTILNQSFWLTSTTFLFPGKRQILTHFFPCYISIPPYQTLRFSYDFRG